MKKLLLMLGTASIIASTAIANDMELKFSGVLEVTSALLVQNDLPQKKQNLSQFNEDIAFSSGAAFNVLATNKTSSDTTYGAKITLLTSTRSKGSTSYNGSHVFAENDGFGKVQFGAPFDAMSTMSVTGFDFAKGAKGVSLSYTKDSPNDVYGMEFFKSTDFLLEDNLRAHNFADGCSVEPARKIAYYTPKLFNDKIQFGISYTPDSLNSADKKYTNKDKVPVRKIKLNGQDAYELPLVATDVISLGMTFEEQLSKDVAVKFGVAGAFGKALQKKRVKVGDKYEYQDLTGAAKVSDLKEFNIGATLTYNNLAFGVSYTDLGDSFTSEEADATTRNTKYLATSVSYTKGPIGVSLSYINSDQRGNIFNGYILGAEYKAAQGVKLYAEAGYANGKGREEYLDPKSKAVYSDGTAILLGAQVSF